ncbi:MAG: helix-turn-helix domain-containing protein, partial [Planctomycetota bacterium]
LLNFRMKTAADLLLQTGMSCREISAYLGFANPYHFSAAFKRVYNISPNEYRSGTDRHGPRLSHWPK